MRLGIRVDELVLELSASCKDKVKCTFLVEQSFTG